MAQEGHGLRTELSEIGQTVQKAFQGGFVVGTLSSGHYLYYTIRHPWKFQKLCADKDLMTMGIKELEVPWDPGGSQFIIADFSVAAWGQSES